MINIRRLSVFLLCLSLFAVPAHASSANKAYYSKAFQAISAGKPDQAEALAAKGPDRVLNKVIRGHAMALPGNNYSFHQLTSFIDDNPSWPGLKGIQMIAEQKIPSAASSAQVVAFFDPHPPITLVGFYRYIDALDQTGHMKKAQKAVRERWVNDDFSADQQTAFLARFSSWLTYQDAWARTDRLLWKNDQVQIRRMLPHLNNTDKAVVDARLAFANQARDINSKLASVPRDARNDPGLLYQHLRWRVRNNQDEEAYEFLLNAPSDLGDPEAWWVQRHIMIRRAIGKKDFALAYRLASRHGQVDPRSLLQAEFVAGFLALRMLNRPDAALEHFQILYKNASTPISRARGAYWQGRAYEALGYKNEAIQSYSDAASFATTFYGQLAITKLYQKPVLIAKADPPQPKQVRDKFFAQDNIKAVEKLSAIGETNRARLFLRSAMEYAQKRHEFVLLTDVALRIKRPDLAIQVVKAANQKNILVLNGGFPLISMRVPTPPEPSFTHALIRQESMFNPDAVSSAGARGLMQLMPATAKEVSRKLGIRYSAQKLDDPEFNIKLGTAFAAQQINRFDGSYILALAGYNAGPSRVREWIRTYGDPRSPEIDPIDWIELMPIQETRNYVQRIIESLQIYRSKLAGGQTGLMILQDLKR